MTINELVEAAHSNAKSHGWWDGDSHNIPEKLALVHSEVSEALEAYRDGEMVEWIDSDRGGKPEGFVTELADAVIRIADLCGHLGLDLEGAIKIKHDFNKGRGYRHGGKRA